MSVKVIIYDNFKTLIYYGKEFNSYIRTDVDLKNGFYQSIKIEDKFNITNECILRKEFDYIKIDIVFGYDKNRDTWCCNVCGVDMGKNNPRQYCGKTFCCNEI
jgi:hypothetical protein